MQVMVMIRVSKETHQALKKAQIFLSHQQGKLLTLDETILLLAEEFEKGRTKEKQKVKEFG